MNARHFEILVEEASMEAALRPIVPRIVKDVTFNIYPYQGKSDLLKKLPGRLQGYRAWLPEDWWILVIMDRDDQSCTELKQSMETAAIGAGFRTRTQGPPNVQVINRLAIEELEAWFFGDWNAVRTAYPKLNANVPTRQGFRDPDAIAGGTWEALEKLLNKSGYFKTGLRKIEAARAIASHMDPQMNRSRSFQGLREAIFEAVGVDRTKSRFQNRTLDLGV